MTGLTAAVFTPLAPDGSLNLSVVGTIADRFVDEGVSGLFVCGTTGEGMSLTTAERQRVAAAWREGAVGRLKIIIQVGHNCLADAKELAAHAQAIGADAVAALPPHFFRPATLELLVESMSQIAAAAPAIPFYYYHIPSLTGVQPSMVDFLRLAGARIPNLAGMKFTSRELDEYRGCLELDGGRFDLLWGPDDMLLDALSVGGRGAVGLTYNVAAPLYLRLKRAYERGDLVTAQACQAHAVALRDCAARFGGQVAIKRIMSLIGPDCGPCRLPLATLDERQTAELHRELTAIGFFDWARHT
ncbi:MAG: dihydrodipicolinate synthase family protein [Planctomycetia bacterium]|nr:dihydrodipicolinate synthase family protein [Planctomycetia bacterium]